MSGNQSIDIIVSYRRCFNKS